MTAVPVMDPVCSLKRDKLMALRTLKEIERENVTNYMVPEPRNCSNELEDLEKKR